MSSFDLLVSSIAQGDVDATKMYLSKVNAIRRQRKLPEYTLGSIVELLRKSGQPVAVVFNGYYL